MATLDDALNSAKIRINGLRSGIADAITPNAAPTAGGAVPPNVAPVTTAAPLNPAPQGLRAGTAQEAARLGVLSPEAAAYQASRAAAVAPGIATAAPVAADAGLAYRAGQAVAPVADAAGNLARLGTAPLDAAAMSKYAGLRGLRAVTSVPGALSYEGVKTAFNGLNTPTDVYARRTGADPNGDFDDSTLGRLQQFGKDVNTRTAGVASDFGANILDLGTSAFNGLRSLTGGEPIQTFNDRLRAGDGSNPALTSSAPTNGLPAATPVPAAPATPSPLVAPDQTFGTGLSAANPFAAPSTNVLPTVSPGITRSGNSFTNIAPDGSLSATSAAPNTGVRFASDADIARLRSAPTPNDPNALFSNPSGVATATGTPMGSEPRMQVSGGSGLGGLFVDRANLRRQQVLGDLGIRQQQLGIQSQDLGLRRDQLGFDRSFRTAELSHRIGHDDATLGISRDQLAREGARDAATQRHQLVDEGLTRDRTTAEMGLRRDQLNREQDATNFTQRRESEADYGKQVAGSISNQLRDAKGNLDPNIVAEHVANANGMVADRITRLRAEVAANPANTTAKQVLDQYQSKGLGALTAAEKEHVQAATEFGQLGRATGSGDFNPFGGTNVEMRTPVASIRPETSLTGSVYRGYDAAGNKLPITVPSRYIDKVEGYHIGGTRNQRFKSLIQGAQ